MNLEPKAYSDDKLIHVLFEDAESLPRQEAELKASAN
jgi:hypothetical protein